MGDLLFSVTGKSNLRQETGYMILQRHREVVILIKKYFPGPGL